MPQLGVNLQPHDSKPDAQHVAPPSHLQGNALTTHLLKGLRTVPLLASRRATFRPSPCVASTLVTSCISITTNISM